MALVFDFESTWAWDTQPQGADFDYFRLCFAWYRALRQLGLNIDILPPDTTDLSVWKLVLMHGLFTLRPTLRAALASAGGTVLLGPRTNSKTPDFGIPPALPLATLDPAEGLRTRSTGRLRFWFNHTPAPKLHEGREIPPAGAVWVPL